eukprot:GHVS01083905.1.p1 GENE.GHVS01083905.1~~GHVS01083905.1.p1  ORF type:complete len:491 (-),score=120.77 GHVS01083905.1:290-1675(-)
MHRLNLIRKLGISSPSSPPHSGCRPLGLREAPDRLESGPYQPDDSELEKERRMEPSKMIPQSIDQPINNFPSQQQQPSSMSRKSSPPSQSASPAGGREDPPPPSSSSSFSGLSANASFYEMQAAEVKEGGGETAFELSTLNVTSRDDFRVNYLKKLSYANVWIPNARKPPQHQTVIIFDWDDTLLSTSYINLRGQEALTPLAVAQLECVARNVISLLELAKKMGRVFIITNAMEGWVEYSVEKYLPSAQQLVTSIKIISARNRYEAAFPGEYYQWKIQAFLEVQRQLNSEIITNLISVGDSIIEMDAVHVMGKEFSQALIKTIKFRENPTPDELAKQLELVGQKFEKICLNARNLKIGLERKWLTAPSDSPSPDSTLSPSTGAGCHASRGIERSSSATGDLSVHRGFAQRPAREQGRRVEDEGTRQSGEVGAADGTGEYARPAEEDDENREERGGGSNEEV